MRHLAKLNIKYVSYLQREDVYLITDSAQHVKLFPCFIYSRTVYVYVPRIVLRLSQNKPPAI